MRTRTRPMPCESVQDYGLAQSSEVLGGMFPMHLLGTRVCADENVESLLVP